MLPLNSEDKTLTIATKHMQRHASDNPSNINPTAHSGKSTSSNAYSPLNIF